MSLTRPPGVRPPASLPSLTGLRWVAAFVVFAYHAGNMSYFSGHGEALVHDVFGAGPTGVSLFFVLSGFVLAWTDDDRVGIRAFWRRRFSRIVPVHLVVLAGALILAATVIPQIRTANPWAVVANASLLSSWNPGWWQAGNPVSWSLVCEAFFYVLFPVVIRALRPRSRWPLVILTVVAVGLVFAVPALHAQLPDVVGANSSPLGRFPEFLVGICLGTLLKAGFWRGPHLLTGVTIALGGYALALVQPVSAFTNSAFTVVGFALLICGLARADMEGRPTLLATPLLVRLGTLSFTFYLVHVLILQTIGSFFAGAMPSLAALPAVGLTAVAFVVSLAVAQLLHTLVEKPARRVLLGGRSPRRIPTLPDDGTSGLGQLPSTRAQADVRAW